MLNRSIKFLLTVLALALLPAASAAAAGHSGAVVFSRAIVTTEKTNSGDVEKLEGGLYAAKDGHLNQLTEDPDRRRTGLLRRRAHDRLRPRWRHLDDARRRLPASAS